MIIITKRKLKKQVKKRFTKILLIILVISLICIGVVFGQYYLELSKELTPIDSKKDYYNLSDFGFVKIKSEYDYNNNGVDDYTDIFNGAKEYAEFNPAYVSKYYTGGYPPVEEEGACTDLIWYALMQAGYDLKSMMAQDIRDEYDNNTYGIEIIDDNIDFRRVGNQEIFLLRYAESLDTDIYNVGDFMPGDIVTFDDSAHIAMISDKYNENGVPYLIQNRDETQEVKEEDKLEITDMQVTGHYRFEYNESLQNLINKIDNEEAQ